MRADTIFDDLRLLGISGLSFQTSAVPLVAFDGMEADDTVAANIFTVDTIATLRLRPTAVLIAGSVTAYVRETNGQYRLDGNSGFPDDGSNVLASDNGALQWFKV